MTKEVELSIAGLQWSEDVDEDTIENIVRAEYFKKGDSHYLLYEERMEGFSQPVKNRIKFKDNILELHRQGLLSTHMIFEENKKHITDYATPYGNLLLAIDTGKIEVEEQEDSIRVSAEYKIEIGDEPISTNKIELRIRPRP
uniref:DUF1934 domain-containing protein n=1 Tax=Acetatifactor sp. TaxID=1872090 RepID=UPI004056F115